MHTDTQPSRVRGRLAGEQGVALIIAMMTMFLLTALGVALILTTTTETKIAGNYSAGNEALYAADAAVERVMQDILTVPDWNTILDGTVRSSFIDGDPGTERVLPNGMRLHLGQATNLLRCGKAAGCSDADMNEYTLDRPWGANNPRWQLYAYAPMEDMLPTATINSQFYVVVWVADDPSECDNNPLRDGEPCASTTGSGTAANPGRGVMAMVAKAYGPEGVERNIEVTLARTDTTEIERGYTGQRGQDEQNRRARKAAVQTPGKALTRRELTVGADASFR